MKHILILTIGVGLIAVLGALNTVPKVAEFLATLVFAVVVSYGLGYIPGSMLWHWLHKVDAPRRRRRKL